MKKFISAEMAVFTVGLLVGILIVGVLVDEYRDLAYYNMEDIVLYKKYKDCAMLWSVTQVVLCLSIAVYLGFRALTYRTR